jgi:hypothetical protein
MGTATLTYTTLTDGLTSDADEVKDNFTALANVVNGGIDNDNISASAAIAGSKLNLATVTTRTTRGNVTIGGTLTQTGVASFTATPKLDHIAENTASHTIVLDNTLTVKKTIQTVTTYTPAGAATATLDLTTGNIHAITMPASGNITIAISNETAGQCFIIEITQGAAGSQTVTWFTTIKWAGGSASTLTTTAAKTEVFGFRVTSADNYLGFIVGQNL